MGNMNKNAKLNIIKCGKRKVIMENKRDELQRTWEKKRKRRTVKKVAVLHEVLVSGQRNLNVRKN